MRGGSKCCDAINGYLFLGFGSLRIISVGDVVVDPLVAGGLLQGCDGVRAFYGLVAFVLFRSFLEVTSSSLKVNFKKRKLTYMLKLTIFTITASVPIQHHRISIGYPSLFKARNDFFV